MKPYTVIVRSQGDERSSMVIQYEEDRITLIISDEEFERAKIGTTVWYQYVPPAPGYDSYSFANPEPQA